MKENYSIRELMDRHYEWGERMGWHNKTPLEYLALISSEVGEAVNECRGEQPTDRIGEELADIILRTIDFAATLKIDIERQILLKMALNEQRGTRGRLV